MVTASCSEHVIPFPYQLVSAGVDWLTATGRRTGGWREVYQQGMSVVDSEVDDGNDMKAWEWQGYEGYKAGGASVGLRYDGAIVQLRSETAQQHWYHIVPTCSNVSRLDLQLTVRLDNAQPHLIRNEYARVRRQKPTPGRPSERTLIDSRLRGSSLYVGRRSSEQYGRMYDKGAEEKCAPVGTLIRWEVEYKKRMAHYYAAKLAATELHHENVVGTISSYFRSRRIRSVAAGVQLLETPPALPSSDATRRLIYLRQVVAPMIEKLKAYYTLDDLLRAVNLYDDVHGETIDYRRRRA